MQICICFCILLFGFFFILIWMVVFFCFMIVMVNELLQIEVQGSFFVGGMEKMEFGMFDLLKLFNLEGQSYYGDYVYVFYQKLVNVCLLLIVMWYGVGQLFKSWEMMVDGCEGFQNLFLCCCFIIYLIDQL